MAVASVEHDLRQQLAVVFSKAKAKHAQLLIERLFEPNPLHRMSISAAFVMVQTALNICVVSLDKPFDTVQEYRRTFWNRLRQLFAEATKRSAADFDYVRARPG